MSLPDDFSFPVPCQFDARVHVRLVPAARRTILLQGRGREGRVSPLRIDFPHLSFVWVEAREVANITHTTGMKLHVFASGKRPETLDCPVSAVTLPSVNEGVVCMTLGEDPVSDFFSSTFKDGAYVEVASADGLPYLSKIEKSLRQSVQDVVVKSLSYIAYAEYKREGLAQYEQLSAGERVVFQNQMLARVARLRVAFDGSLSA